MAGDDDDKQQPPPAKIQANSPFFLGSQDRPGDFITPTRLRADNYDDWAGDMQTALQARRKFEFLDGTITKPTPPCTQSDWNTINAMLVSWIMNTIDHEVKSTLTKHRDAKRLWDHLKKRYESVNGPRIQQLKSSIARCEQTKTMSVTTYYGKLNALWEELANHEPIIACKCCSSCTAGRLHEERQDKNRLHEFLMGLYSEYYSQLRTNILSQDPMPTLDRAYQLVVQDERVRLAKTTTDTSEVQRPTDALGFSVRTGAGRGRGRGEKVVCTYCKKSGHEASNCWSLLVCNHCKKHGHEVSNCFELVGYPEGWNEQAKNNGATSRGRGRGRGQARANAVIHGAVGSSTNNLSSSSTLFSPEQWKAIAGLVGNSPIPESRLNGPTQGADWNGS